MAVSDLAKKNRTSDMSLDEINAEIEEVRKSSRKQ